MTNPRVLIMADVPNWAWGMKASRLKRFLSEDFDIDIWYTTKQQHSPKGYDLYHTFEFPQVRWVDHSNVPLLTGLTAHVWQTWGETQVKRWVKRATALHANSLLLQKEIRQFHEHVYYTPNGVCTDQFRRIRSRKENKKLIVGHVGKPIARKGGEIIQAACKIADVELRMVQRRSGDALTFDEMVEWYQDIHVMVFASDMDGTPNPALEGAACECAIVSNEIGNMPEFILKGHNGFVVERTAPSIAGQLNYMKNNLDEVIEMGVNARRTVLNKWTWAHQVNHYRHMWNEVLGR